jgi:hypothetical protein
MRNLPVPTDSALEVFTLCIRNVKDTGLRTRLLAISRDIEAAEAEFQAAGQTASYFRLTSANGVGGVSRQEMVAVYDNRLVKKTAPGRRIYDKIVTSAPNDKCPLCGHRNVKTLDHYLPKSLFPALTVTPMNLIPACSDCNKAKLPTAPTAGRNQTLHPYFDNVETEQWLTGEVVHTSPAAVRFSVTKPDSWTATMAERVRHHFKMMGLGALYATNAAEELENIKYQLESLRQNGGARAVREYLQESADSRESAHLNSWQTALYKALARDRWFYRGGFRSAP